MSSVATMTLRQMREAKGYTAQEAASRVAEVLGRPSYHFSSVLKAEAGGIRDIDVLRAYATVYGRSLDEVEFATR